jgi:hypothetical protein
LTALQRSRLGKHPVLPRNAHLGAKLRVTDDSLLVERGAYGLRVRQISTSWHSPSGLLLTLLCCHLDSARARVPYEHAPQQLKKSCHVRGRIWASVTTSLDVARIRSGDPVILRPCYRIHHHVCSRGSSTPGHRSRRNPPNKRNGQHSVLRLCSRLV